MTVDTKTIETLHKAGIEFVASLRVPGGGMTVSISPSEIQAFVADHDAFAARSLGVNKELYLEWVEMDGEAQCVATTTSGRRCENLLPGSGQRDINEWLKIRGGRCTVHGGPGKTRK